MTSTRRTLERLAAQRIGDVSPGQGRPEVVQWSIDAPPRPDVRERSTPWAVRAVLATAALVLVGVVGTHVLSSRAPATGPAAAGTASSQPPVAPGWQRISSLGLEVDAPASWPVNTWLGCGTEVPTEQVNRGVRGRPVCLSTALPASRLTIEPTLMTVLDGRAVTRDVTTADGTSAVLIPRKTDGQAETVLFVASRNLEVLVASPDPAVVDRIIASVRFVDVDSAGCRTAFPAAPPWDHASDGPKIDVGDPTSIAVCLYERSNSGTLLGASTVLTGTAARTAAAALDEARAGTVPDVAADCTPGEPDSQVVVHLRYADDRSIEGRLHFSGCTDRWAATPTGISQATVAQLQALTGPLGLGASSSHHISLPKS